MQGPSLEIEKTVLSLLHSKFQGDPSSIELTPETDIFGAYGLDSMDVLDFTLELSNTLGISFGETIDDIESLVNYGSLLTRVSSVVENRTANTCPS